MKRFIRPYFLPAYEGSAYYALDKSLIFSDVDENILIRRRIFPLEVDIWHTDIGRNRTLMEIKTSGGIPLWMVETPKIHYLKHAFRKCRNCISADDGCKNCREEVQYA